MPAINITKTAPIEPRNIMEGVNSISPSPNGPITIPATIKATTYGRCSLLKNSEKNKPEARIITKPLYSLRLM